MAASTPTAVAQAVSGPAAPPLPAAPAVKPAPVVAAAPPAATPASLTETPAPVRAAIIAAVEQWRQAWSSKNIAAYLASYDPKYTLIGLTRAEWQTQRAERIRRAAAINVTVSDVIMAQESDGAVAVSFIQKYESPAFKESGRKLLVFGDYNGKWLIREESFLANSK